MQIDRILGNVGVLYVGAYNSSTQYEYLNCVTYNGSSYVCVNQNGVTGVTPGTTNDWQLSAQKGDTGGQGIQGEQGIQGATGNGIQSITKTSSNGLTDTYTILFTDGSSTTFEVENGKGIVSIEKTSSEGNVDTYTITYNDDTTSTFTVTNGEVTNEELQQALAQERVISDGKYARALKTPVTDVESTQIYAENDVVNDLVVDGVELTQETREGYNLLSTENLQELNENGIVLTKENGIITINGQSTSANFIDDYFIGSSSAYEEFLPAGRYTVSGITGEALSPNFGILVIIKHLDESTVTIMQNSENKSFTVREGDTFRIFIRIPQNLQLSNVVIKPMIVAGEENKDFEQYGASPSLDFPSEVQVASEQNISIRGNNMCKSYTNTDSTQLYNVALYIDADLKPNTKYTISFLTPTFEAEYYRSEELTSNWFTVINNGKRQTFTFTTKENIIKGKNGYLFFKNSRTQPNPANFSEIMLVEGDTDLPYEPYYGTDIIIPLVNSAIGQYADTIDRENNVQNKVIEKVSFNSNLDWTYNQPENKFICSIPAGVKVKDISLPQLCTHYKIKGDFASNENEFACTANGFRFHNDNNMTLEEWKTFLEQQNQAGTPLTVYYIAGTPTTNPLSEEIQTALSNFKLYQDLNNVAIDGGSMSFIYNKSLSKTIEEMQDEIQSKDTLIQNLTTRVEALEKAQVDNVGGN